MSASCQRSSVALLVAYVALGISIDGWLKGSGRDTWTRAIHGFCRQRPFVRYLLAGVMAASTLHLLEEDVAVIAEQHTP